MKRMIVAFTTLAIAGAGVQSASAGGCGGGCGWFTAGAVLAGVTAGVVVGSALAPRPAYYTAPPAVYYPSPGYGCAYSYTPAPQPAVVYSAPAPVVVYRPAAYVAPPVVSVGFGYYGGCRSYYYRRGCW